MPNPFDRSKMRDRMKKVRGHEKREGVGEGVEVGVGVGVEEGVE
jgi:hypothetical protein